MIRASSVNQAADHHCVSDWSWRPDGFTDCDFWLVCGGEGRGRFAGRDYALRRGACFLFCPGPHGGCFEHNPRQPLHVLAVHFDLRDGTFPRLFRQVTEVEFMGALLERVVHAWEHYDQPLALRWLNAALAELVAIDSASSEAAPDPTRAGICAVVDRILAEPERPWQIPELAAEMGLCADHFGRLFRGQIGIPPGAFVVNARLDAARRLLRMSSHPVKRIAALCGYSTVQFFTRQFREKTGITPTAFRRVGRTSACVLESSGMGRIMGKSGDRR